MSCDELFSIVAKECKSRRKKIINGREIKVTKKRRKIIGDVRIFERNRINKKKK